MSVVGARLDVFERGVAMNSWAELGVTELDDFSYCVITGWEVF